MVEAKELKIGNYVYYTKSFSGEDVERIEVVDVDLLKEMERTSTFPRVKPITLTEEILLKCGFEQRRKGFIELSDDAFISFNNNHLGVHNDIYSDDIEYELPKYLHQLQNLYFALTNQELKIEL